MHDAHALNALARTAPTMRARPVNLRMLRPRTGRCWPPIHKLGPHGEALSQRRNLTRDAAQLEDEEHKRPAAGGALLMP